MQIYFPAPGDAPHSGEYQPMGLNYSQSDQRGGNASKLLQSRDSRCVHVRKEVRRNQHMAGLLTAIQTLVHCNDFSLAPATGETAWGLVLIAMSEDNE